MRTFVAFLTCFVLLTSAEAQPKKQTEPATKTLKKVAPSIVKVYGAGGFTGIPAYGTGIVVDERGFILTAWSIALRTDELKIVTHDGKRYAAQLWAPHPGLGVAILKAQPPKEGILVGFKALRLADSRKLRPGDPVLGVGNPFGIVYGAEPLAVMRGVVSAVASPRRGGARVIRLPPHLKTVILTDMPNNPGTQGGPLLTLDGDLVGVLGRLVETRTTNTILNFAVPSSSIADFVRDAVDADKPLAAPRVTKGTQRKSRVQTGIRLQRAHLVRSPLAYVERVARRSPAARAGVLADDLIFRLGARTIHSCRDWDEAMAEVKPGQKVVLVVKRGSIMRRLELVIPEKKP